MDDRSGVIKLLNMMKSLSRQNTDQNYYPLSLYIAMKSAYGLQQGTHTTNTKLVQKLKARVEVVK